MAFLLWPIEGVLLTNIYTDFIYLFPFVQSKKKEIVCFCLKNRIQCFRCPEVVLIRGAHFPSFKRLRRSEVVFHACSLIFFLTSKKQQPELSQLWRKAFVVNSLSSNAKRNLHSYWIIYIYIYIPKRKQKHNTYYNNGIWLLANVSLSAVHELISAILKIAFYIPFLYSIDRSTRKKQKFKG